MKKIEVINGRKRVFTENKEPSMTDQSQKKQCDINVIIAKYRKTGQLDHVKVRQGLYQDVSNIPDLIGAYEAVAKAQEAFDSIPANLRKRLNNDPVQFMEYLQDPANDQEAVRLGIKVLVQKDENGNVIASSEQPPSK